MRLAPWPDDWALWVPLPGRLCGDQCRCVCPAGGSARRQDADGARRLLRIDLGGQVVCFGRGMEHFQRFRNITSPYQIGNQTGLLRSYANMP